MDYLINPVIAPFFPGGRGQNALKLKDSSDLLFLLSFPKFSD